MLADQHTHAFDQYLLVAGGDINNVYISWDAEMEFGLEGQLYSIPYPVCILFPK
jgi:hypothetical protein